VQGGLLLDVVVSQGATILKLLTSKDQTLLVRRNTCSKNSSQNKNFCYSQSPKALLEPLTKSNRYQQQVAVLKLLY